MHFNSIVLDIIQLYACLLILRSLLYYSGMNKTEPAAKLTIRLSQPLLRPIQRFFPCIKGFETVSLFMAFLLIWAIRITHLLLIAGHQFSLKILSASLISAIFSWVNSILTIYCIVIVISIILSFFAPYAPTLKYIEKILAPVRQPFHMLKLGRLDFSILPFFLMAQWSCSWGLPQLSHITTNLIMTIV